MFLICSLLMTSAIRSKSNLSLKSISYLFSSFILITILPLSADPSYSLYFLINSFLILKSSSFNDTSSFWIKKNSSIEKPPLSSIFLTSKFGVLRDSNIDFTFFFVTPLTLNILPSKSTNSGTAKTSRPCVFFFIFIFIFSQ